ncbi:MAG: hypothetical protein ACTTKL_06790 [Treponema sp.]
MNAMSTNAPTIKAAHASETGTAFSVRRRVLKTCRRSRRAGQHAYRHVKNPSEEDAALSGTSQLTAEKFNAIFQPSESVRRISAQLTAAKLPATAARKRMQRQRTCRP